MIAFARTGDRLTVHLRGPETRATQLTCPAGWEFFGAELQLGAYLPLFPPSGLADLNDALLPTLSGASDFDSNYADNPLLTSLTGLGYTGAFWAHWRDREVILRRAKELGLLATT